MKIRFAFICDEARREDNGKMIFIGVYGRNIIPNEFPFNFLFSLVVFFDSEKSIEMPFAMHVYLDEDQIAEGGGIAKLEEGQGITIIQKIPVSGQRPGKLSFRIKLGDDDWQTIASIPITRSSSSTASPPLAS